jgi:hypothetical protein
MRTLVARAVVLLIASLLLSSLPVGAQTQEPQSAALAKELGQLLDQKKLSAFAAKDPSAPDVFVAALYYPASQMMVVSARYAVPSIMAEKIAKKDYLEVYTDLNSAAVEGSKMLVMDLGADGVKPKKEESHIDTCDIGAKAWVFDGDWKKQKMASEEEYTKAFAQADAAYSKALAVLIAQVKKI